MLLTSHNRVSLVRKDHTKNEDPLTILVLSAVLSIVFLLTTPCASGQASAIEQSVVRIVNYSQRGDWFAPWGVSATREDSGSGFVIQGGRVMTTAHLVSDSRMCILYLHGDPNPHQAHVVMIGQDCDLALLEPVEPGLLDKIPAVTFGRLPEIRSTVETYGYPVGGRQLSSTRGVVSRVDFQVYGHSGLDKHLTVQTDAAINPGNSGGPVVQNDSVVGVAFQVHLRLQNVGFFIPTDVIEHFLADAADGSYEGYPELGVLTAGMENPTARQRAGMAFHERGVTVTHVLRKSSADGHLKVGDILLHMEGYDIANDGTVAINGLRFEFGVLVDRLQVGGFLALDVLRAEKRFSMTIPMKGYPAYKRFANRYNALPRYYIYGGLVFVPLERELLKLYGQEWMSRADKPLLYEFFFRYLEDPDRITKEPVVLLRCLDHRVNANFPWRGNQLVEKVNHRPIHSLEDLIDAIETNKDPYHLIEFAYHGRFGVLDRGEADRTHKDILRLYGVVEDRRL